MFGPKVKLDGALYDKLKQCAEAGGYSSVDEFVAHVLEREVKRITSGGGDSSPGGDAGASDEEEEKIRKRLQGLGYIS